MEYRATNLSKLIEAVYAILNDDSTPAEDAEVFFDILEFLEEHQQHGTPALIETKAHNDIISQYKLMGFLQEVKKNDITVYSPENNVLGSDDALMPQDFDSLEEATLEDLEHLIHQGTDAQLRLAVIDLERMAATPGEFQARAQLLKALGEEKENQLAGELRIAIAEALEENKIKIAEDAFQRLETLRPEDITTKETKEEIVVKKEMLRISNELEQAKNQLRTYDDYHRLLRGLELSRRLLAEGKGDAELAELWDEAEEKRADIARQLFHAQTMGLMEEFQKQVDTYADLIVQGIFEVPHPDDPAIKVSTGELLKEARNNLLNSKRQVVQARCDAAQALADSEPGIAQYILKQLDDFIGEFSGEDIYIEYTELTARLDVQFRLWKDAAETIDAADRLVNPREQLVEYEKAQNVFPGHVHLPEKIVRCKARLRERIYNEADGVLKALQRQLDFQRPLIRFRAIETELGEVRELLFELGEPTEKLSALETELDAIYQALGHIERRHTLIKEIAVQIETGLAVETPDVDSLRDMLDALSEEDRNHASLSNARIRIARLSTEQDMYQKAMDALGRRDYSEAIALALGISAMGDLANQRSQLITEAQLQLDWADLGAAMARLDYDAARPKVDAFAGRLRNDHPLYSDVNSVRERIERYEGETQQFSREFDHAVSADALDLVARLKKLNELLGRYRDRRELVKAIDQTRDEIRNQNLGWLKAFEQKNKQRKTKKPTYEEAEKARQSSVVLEELNLVKSDAEVALIRWAREIYQKAEVEYYTSKGGWSEIITALEDRYKENPPLNILETLDSARRNKALADIRHLLNANQPDAEKAMQILNDVKTKNGKLRNDLEIVLLESVLTLYLQQYPHVNRNLQIARRIDAASPFIEQINSILKSLPLFHRRKDEADQYAERKQYVYLVEQLNQLDQEFADLIEKVHHPEAQAFLEMEQSEYEAQKSVRLSRALKELIDDLDNQNKSVAEQVQILGLIEKLDPENTIIKTRQAELIAQIPVACIREIKKAKDFCADGQYVRIPVQDSSEAFINFDNILSAFLGVAERQKGVLDQNQIQELDTTRVELSTHRGKIDDLRDLISPYLEYKAAIAQEKELSADENICIASEKGLENSNQEAEEILGNPVVERFNILQNPDVIAFEKWSEQVISNRKQALEWIEEMKKGVNYRVGVVVTDADDLEQWRKKYDACYEAIIDAYTQIKSLTSNRKGDVYGLDTETMWFDSFMDKDVKGVENHFRIAENRKRNLKEYYDWYTKVVAIAPPIVNAIPQPEYDDLLTGMEFSIAQFDVKQEMERLQVELKQFFDTHSDLPVLNEVPQDVASSRICKEGTEKEQEALQGAQQVSERMIIYKNEYEGFAGKFFGFKKIHADTARKLAARHPALKQIRKNLIELHRLDPTHEASANLLETYRKKCQKEQRRFRFWPFR